MKHWDMDLLQKRLDECLSMAEAEKLVYQWVKQDQISPKQMSDLLVTAFKKFIY